MNPGIHGAIIAAQQAQEKKRQEDEEEERMTRYNPEELEGEWEFKIIRSQAPVFRKPGFLQQVLQEEAQAGWKMLEKLDDNRIRMKRPASAKRRDPMLPPGVDPYRTQIQRNTSLVISLITGIILLGVGIVVFFFNGSSSGNGIEGGSYIIISIVVLLMLTLGLVVAAKARS